MDYTLCPSNFVISPCIVAGIVSGTIHSFAFGNSSVRALDCSGDISKYSSRSTLRDKQICVQPLLIFACLVSSIAQAIAPTRRPFGAGSVRATGSRAICECDLRGLYCVPNDSVLQPLQSCMPALYAVASFCQNSAVSCLHFVPNEPAPKPLHFACRNCVRFNPCCCYCPLP